MTLRVSPPVDVVFDTNSTGSSARDNYMKSQAAAFKSRRVILAALRQDEVKRLGLEARYPDAVDWIETQIKTEFADGSDLLTITLNAADPTDATTVLKNLTNSYMDEVVYAEQTAKAARLADVEKIYTDAGSNLNRKRENFKQDAERAGIAVGSADHDYLTLQQKTLLENLHDAKVQRNQEGMELSRVQAELETFDLRVQTAQKLDLDDAAVDAAMQTDPIAGRDLAVCPP